MSKKAIDEATIPTSLNLVVAMLKCALSHPVLPEGKHSFNPHAKLVPDVFEIYKPLFDLYQNFGDSKDFREPPNAVELGIFNYYDVITEPMSLRDVLDRLEQGDYSNASQVMDDVQKIWKNTETFNGPNSPYVIKAQECDKYLKTQIQKRRDDIVASAAEQEKLLNRVTQLAEVDERIIEEVITMAQKIQPNSLVDGEVEFQVLTVGSVRKLTEFVDRYETQSGSIGQKRGRQTPA